MKPTHRFALHRLSLPRIVCAVILASMALSACRAPAPTAAPGGAGSTRAAYPAAASATPPAPGYPVGTLPPSATPPLAATLAPTATSDIYLPIFSAPGGSPTPTPTTAPPPTLTPTPTLEWPAPLSGQTASKLSVHVILDDDPYVREFVKRAHPRVVKGVDDLGWLAQVKAASPDIVTVGRFTDADAQEHWPDTTDPVAAANAYLTANLERYRRYPSVDYWEGWNEFVPVTEARWQWFAQFEAQRACAMQAQGLRAAVGGFAYGTPEYAEMALFLPALEAARRCGGIFTLHEGVPPTLDCSGVSVGVPGVIPGAPVLNVPAGIHALRYRFWYEGYLKPRGLGDLPLVISEVAVAPNPKCGGPDRASWKDFRDWWVQQGVGPDGARAYLNLLTWYDRELRQDPYVLGATIFTAGAQNSVFGAWNDFDLHEILFPLTLYAVDQQ
jgi:hypothetical protein